MKILIVYATKTGTTQKCAEILRQQLENTTLVNLKTKEQEIAEYDCIIIGSPIRIGMIDKSVKQFITKNKELLRTKKVAYFICCGFNDNWKQYYESNIPKELLEEAVTYESFGGELDITKQKGFDKFVVNMVTKNMEQDRETKILEENIEEFIKKIKEIH